MDNPEQTERERRGRRKKTLQNKNKPHTRIHQEGARESERAAAPNLWTQAAGTQMRSSERAFSNEPVRWFHARAQDVKVSRCRASLGSSKGLQEPTHPRIWGRGKVAPSVRVGKTCSSWLRHCSTFGKTFSERKWMPAGV